MRIEISMRATNDHSTTSIALRIRGALPSFWKIWNPMGVPEQGAVGRARHRARAQPVLRVDQHQAPG